jgi:preprotein translocase subunit SecA
MAPTNRPMIRVDHSDMLLPTKLEKEQAVIDEIRKVHQASCSGRHGGRQWVAVFKVR